MMDERPLHQVELACDPAAALAAVGDAAEAWGGEWRADGFGGQLALPFVAGLHRGVHRGRVRTESTRAGCRVSFEIEATDSTVHRQALGVLLLGAAGGLTVMLWPFFPALAAVAPLAAVLALVAWLLVVSRLRSSGPEEFLAGLDGPG